MFFDRAIRSEKRRSTRAVWLALAAAALCVLGSCHTERNGNPLQPDPRGFQDLTQRDHVLFNLELAYHQQDLEQFERLLLDDFWFCSDALCWDGAEELAITDSLFAAAGTVIDSKPVDRIRIALAYDPGSWVPSTPDDPIKYPGETFYEKTVTYTVQMVHDPESWIFGVGQATFVIRQITSSGGKKTWRIRGIFDHDGPWVDIQMRFAPE